MTPYSIDLRSRIVGFVNAGHTKTDAALHFKVSWKTVYRYCKAAKHGSLEPKPQGGKKGLLNGIEEAQNKVVFIDNACLSLCV